MSTKSTRSKSPSPSSSPSSSNLVNDASPVWLPSGPWILSDNHEDAGKDIWTTPWNRKHWDESRDMLKKHDKKALEEWNDEINTQLLVSSLLAAVAGGFVVESQKGLSEDPAITSAVILLQIARQLNESIGLPNTDFMAFGGPSPVERAFNSLFYASLGLSLANVTLGLLCLQWIRGMRHEPPGVPRRQYPDLRYTRYLGFERWGAKGIISALPLLLLAALLTFFVGLLTFASHGDWISSIPLYIVLLSVFAIVLFTTFVPGLVVILNSAFRKGSEFPSVPPFRSLQSWIAMQGFIHIFQAVNRIFKVNPFGAFVSLRKCLDWGQLDQLWTRWSVIEPEDSIFFPLILSTGTLDDMNTISNICEEVFSQEDDPKFRKLAVLKQLASYGTLLPATTLGDISELLITELVALINVGTSLDALSSAFEIEKKMVLDFVPTDTTLQLVNSLSFLCRTAKPSIEGFWNLFWRALGDSIQGVPYMYNPETAPILFHDALDSIQVALEDPSTGTQTIFQSGFKSLIEVLAYEMEHERAWARSETGSNTVSAIVSHPIWIPARKIIASLPPGKDTAVAHKCLRTLDRIRQKLRPRAAAGIDLVSQEEGSPGGKEPKEGKNGRQTTAPHIAIDMEPKYDDDRPIHAVASSQVAIDTGPKEDRDPDEREGQSGYEERLDTIMVSTPAALPTHAVHSTTSLPPRDL